MKQFAVIYKQKNRNHDYLSQLAFDNLHLSYHFLRLVLVQKKISGFKIFECTQNGNCILKNERINILTYVS